MPTAKTALSATAAKSLPAPMRKPPRILAAIPPRRGSVLFAVLSMPSDSTAVFWSNESVTVDTFPDRQICYRNANAPASAEQVCASFGPKTGSISTSHTAVYQIKF